MELTNLIHNIELLRRELSALQPLPAERQEKLDKKFRLEFNYNSNHIEGNTLTYGETMLYLIFDKTTGEHEGREYEEMKASDAALKLVQDFAADNERPLTEAFIKNLNKIILVRPYWANAITPDGQNTRREISIGDYKKYPNSVRLQNGEMFHYASPQETPSLMDDLIQWYREETEKKELHAIVIAALLHYKFVRIHPFDDGNGRISRLLMNYVIYYHGLPPVIIKSADKKNYLQALNKADTGDINSFVEYIAKQLLWSLELSIKAAKGEDIEEGDDVDKEVAIWKKELKSKKTVQVIPKSADTLKKLYLENLRPFIGKMENRIAENFRDLFNNWEISAIANNEEVIGGLPFLDAIFDSTRPFLIESPENLFSIRVDTNLNGFNRNLKNHFGVSVKIEVLFNPNDYQLKVFTHRGTQQYLDGGRIYNQTITLQEQETIINNTVKNIFTYIKENTEM